MIRHIHYFVHPNDVICLTLRVYAYVYVHIGAFGNI